MLSRLPMSFKTRCSASERLQMPRPTTRCSHNQSRRHPATNHSCTPIQPIMQLVADASMKLKLASRRPSSKTLSTGALGLASATRVTDRNPRASTLAPPPSIGSTLPWSPTCRHRTWLSSNRSSPAHLLQINNLRRPPWSARYPKMARTRSSKSPQRSLRCHP